MANEWYIKLIEKSICCIHRERFCMFYYIHIHRISHHQSSWHKGHHQGPIRHKSSSITFYIRQINSLIFSARIVACFICITAWIQFPFSCIWRDKYIRYHISFQFNADIYLNCNSRAMRPVVWLLHICNDDLIETILLMIMKSGTPLHNLL